MDETTALGWRTSSFSSGGNQCVEVADLPDGGRLVRNTKNRDGGTLAFTAAEWVAFTAGVRSGEFD
ncbi:DUF397 domain-containing protein [Pseudonocardia sp. GCM10023141]|uniref:DUF397 domain-containing protein n=1 Tax=Pseudonocardia sp. GCM10023141 TaxID=3252653 RepID=UPI003611785E